MSTTRHRQLSLRSLFAAFLMLSLILSIVGYRVRRGITVERFAVLAQAASANVDIEHWPWGSSYAFIGDPSWSVWLRERFCWPRVIEVSSYAIDGPPFPAQHLSEFPELKYLTLPPNCVKPDLQELVHLRELQQLRLAGSELSDEGLGVIGSMRNLRELDLRLINLTRPGLQHLAELPDLEWLRVNIDARLVPVISSFRCARTLLALDITIEGIPRPADMVALGTFKNLKHLQLGGRLGDVHIVQLARSVPAIEELELEGDLLSSNALKAIGSLQRLESLHVVRLHEADTLLLGLTHLPRLQRLSLEDTDLTGKTLSCWSSLPLSELEIVGAPLEDRALLDLACLKNLRQLHLIGVKLSSDATDRLRRSRVWRTFDVQVRSSD